MTTVTSHDVVASIRSAVAIGNMELLFPTQSGGPVFLKQTLDSERRRSAQRAAGRWAGLLGDEA